MCFELRLVADLNNDRGARVVGDNPGHVYSVVLHFVTLEEQGQNVFLIDTFDGLRKSRCREMLRNTSVHPTTTSFGNSMYRLLGVPLVDEICSTVRNLATRSCVRVNELKTSSV